MASISLNAGIRASLTQLNRTTAAFNETTNRLATGKKVSSAIDNPTNFFAAVNLNDRAEGLSARLDSMGQAVQRIQAADNGISTIRTFISAMKGIVNNALSDDSSDARADLGKQFNELINQVGTVAVDSSYQGINLLHSANDDGESEIVQFNETFNESTLEVKGFSIEVGSYVSSTGVINSVGGSATNVSIGGATVTNITVAGVGGATAQGAALVISTQDSTTAVGVQGYGTGANTVGGGTINWSDNNYQDSLAKVITQLEAYDNALKMQSGALANNLMTITTREEFSTNMINTIEEGADELTLADLNEEGANLLSLQSTNQLATQSLSLSSQQSQTVVQLMG